MAKEILISIDELENRVAVVENGRLMEIYIVREERQVGSIYNARVVNILPGMQAAFVDIGLDRNAFLCIDDIVRYDTHEQIDFGKVKSSIKDILKVNSELLVQIVKESMAGKGARVSTHISLPGRFLVFLPFANYIGVSRRIEDEAERNRLRQIIEGIKPEGVGLIIRTAAEGADDKQIKKDLAFLSKLWERIGKDGKRKKAPCLIHEELNLIYKVIRDHFTEMVDRLVIDSRPEHDKIHDFLRIISPQLRSRVELYEDKVPLFDVYGIEKEIEKSLQRRVWLESGGYLIIDKTEALTVIDVNTGRFTGKHSLEDTIFQTNIESAVEIARQLRLRDVGGIIIIDFIDMEEESHKAEILLLLEKELTKDRTKTNLIGMTELGLVQITRKRISKDLDETLRDFCPYCLGRGRIFSIETMRIKIERSLKRMACETKYDSILVKVNPKLAFLLLGWEGEAWENMELSIGKSIFLRVDPLLHQEKVEYYSGHKNDIEKLIVFFHPGERFEVEILETYGFNLQSGIGYHKGNIIEIIDGGNRIGEVVNVILTKVSRSYHQAQIDE